jgi:hypothetical protein
MKLKYSNDSMFELILDDMGKFRQIMQRKFHRPQRMLSQSLSTSLKLLFAAFHSMFAQLARIRNVQTTKTSGKEFLIANKRLDTAAR